MKMTLCAALAVSLFVAAAFTAYPSLAQGAGIDFWNVVDLQSGLSTREDESRALDRESEVAVHRTLVRVEIATDVIEGRLSFEEGAARFDELNRSNPRTLKFARMSYEGKSDEERAGRQLFAHLQVHEHPKAGTTAVAVAQRWLRERY